MSKDEAEETIEETIEVPLPKEVDQEEQDINLLVYRMFLNYPDPDQVPIKAIAEQLKITTNKVGALLGSAKRNPSTYQRLTQMGYDDPQIPKWIPREAPSDQEQTEGGPEQPETPQERLPQPLKTPASLQIPGDTPPIGTPSPVGQTTTVRSSLPGQGQQTAGERARESLEAPSRLAQVYGQEDEVRRNLEKANIVQTNDGRWMQPQTMEDRSVRMVEVDVSEALPITSTLDILVLGHWVFVCICGLAMSMVSVTGLRIHTHMRTFPNACGS